MIEREVLPGEGETVARFPIRVASLDMGSNAIRFTVAEFSDEDHFAELEVQRLSVRLGHDTFTGGSLLSGTLEAAVAVTSRFRQRLDDFGVVRYRAVATSAVRESRNGPELVERIRQESGIHLETITGSEEARLAWLAVKHRVAVTEGTWILADLGGGSMEISLIDQGGIQSTDSHPMGTVRLLEDLSRMGEEPGNFRHLAERYTSRLSLPLFPDEAIAGVIITGGNAEALADLLGSPRDPKGVSELHRLQVAAAVDRLAGMTIEDRIRRLGLREDRADVILPAAIIFNRIAVLAGCSRLLVPRVGVKDGVLYDLAADVAGHDAHESELDRIAFSGAVSLGRRYRFDESHARHVRNLAVSLFDQLRDLHGLDEGSRRRLSTAALLHDIGQFISYRRHHKHSWYLIANAELPGLSPEDIRMVALIGRYHRRSEPKEYHEGYSELDGKQRAEVQKLAALLRIADGLDREHHRHVRRIAASLTDRKVVLELETASDTTLEIWATRDKSPLFERVFEVGLELR